MTCIKILLPLSLSFVIFCWMATAIQAQEEDKDSLQIADLQPVTVAAFRLEEAELNVPVALSSVGEYRLQHGQQQLSIQESLNAIPGVFVLNADNFSQDVRVAIRGFGARSAFGIRGVRLLLDGLPETSPDGQGQVDNIEPGMLKRVSVIRSAVSGLYGNASGGVLDFNTLQFSFKRKTEVEAGWGAFGFQKYQARLQDHFKKKLLLSSGLSYTSLDGYRAQSGTRGVVFNTGLKVLTSENAALTFLFNWSFSPKAEDSGALTLEQVAGNPRAARQQNVDFDAGEKVDQRRVGLVYEKRWNANNSLKTQAWTTARDFSNKLPFEAGGWVELNRLFYGVRSTFVHTRNLLKKRYSLAFGVELEGQNDRRKRFDNLKSVQGSLVFDQWENLYNSGLFLTQQWEPSRKFHTNASVRADFSAVKANDKFLTDGDDSGDRQFNRLNPIIGLTFSPTHTFSAYGNFSTSYETPALSELSANPEGGGGFNATLSPQQAVSYEAGIKGLLAGERLRYDLALFYIGLNDEFTAYEIGSFPGRTFYRNAASSHRNGLEAGVGVYWGAGIYSYFNYTFSNFRYDAYESGGMNFDGNRQPGIPRHLGYAELRYFKPKGFFAAATLQYVGHQWADDGNMAEVPGYWLCNLRAGFLKKFTRWQMEPYIGVNNLFDTMYFSNIRINAAAGRYYEPAAGRHLFFGLKMGIAEEK
jgi:iron complex outermembrane receptor protein